MIHVSFREYIWRSVSSCNLQRKFVNSRTWPLFSGDIAFSKSHLTFSRNMRDQLPHPKIHRTFTPSSHADLHGIEADDSRGLYWTSSAVLGHCSSGHLHVTQLHLNNKKVMLVGWLVVLHETLWNPKTSDILHIVCRNSEPSKVFLLTVVRFIKVYQGVHFLGGIFFGGG